MPEKPRICIIFLDAKVKFSNKNILPKLSHVSKRPIFVLFYWRQTYVCTIRNCFSSNGYITLYENIRLNTHEGHCNSYKNIYNVNEKNYCNKNENHNNNKKNKIKMFSFTCIEQLLCDRILIKWEKSTLFCYKERGLLYSNKYSIVFNLEKLNYGNL